MEGIFTLVAFVVAWLVAQVWKLIDGLLHGGAGEGASLREVIGYCFRSGGMPSGHTASLTAATVYLGYAEGVTSGIFALAVCLWLIVVYDATHVRYAVGEQGKALNKLLAEAKEAEVPLVEGHTVGQVVVGAIIGILIGVVVGVCYLGGLLH